jgi:hypothetical protein
MDAAAHYRHLLSLGRDEFLAAAAPAVLVRFRAPARNPPASRAAALAALALDQDVGETVDGTLPHGKFTEEATEMELYPLAKKPGASFPDRITIGRTLHNDVVISEPSVSRLHAYARLTDGWVIADAGSKNGSWLGDRELEPRREVALVSGTVLRLGDIQLTFYLSSDLFDRQQGGDHGSR